MTIRRVPVALLALAALLPPPSVRAVAQDGYRTPPQDVVDILDAAPFPQAVVGPSGDRMILAFGEAMPGIETLAAPMLRLAGRRISPVTNGMHAAPPFARFSVVDLRSGDTRQVTAAEDGLGPPLWSPAGDRFAFTRTTSEGVALWLADPGTGAARVLTAPSLNGARGEPCAWMPGGRSLLCHFVVADRGPAPRRAAVPAAPIVQESGGEATPSWTFQDLLGDAHDEALFDYYLTSQPTLVDATTGDARPVGDPAAYESLEPSPSGEYFLAVLTVRPYSYLVPDSRFAKEVRILASDGRTLRTLANLPLDEGGPEHLGFRRPGPRQFAWRSGTPAVLAYMEALDGGNPALDAPHRDRVLTLAAPFEGEATELIRTEHRLGSGAFGFGYPVLWGEDGETAIVYEFDWPTRRTRAWAVQAASPGAEAALLWDRSTDDWYGNPGAPVMTQDASGKPAVRMDGTSIFLSGPGGSPDGDRPFLDRLDLATGRSERLFHSRADSYEAVVGLADARADRIVIRRETGDEPPNYHLIATADGERTALTSFPNPQPQLAGITKRKIYYERDDGIPLSGELYLPADYRPGDRPPVLVWAYPREYADEDGAGQVRGSAHRFTTVSGASHLLLLTQGYRGAQRRRDADRRRLHRERQLRGAAGGERQGGGGQARRAGRGRPRPHRDRRTQLRGLHDRQHAGPLRRLRRRNRAQRRLQPEPDALRLPVRAPHLLGGAGGLLPHVGLHARREDQRAPAPDPRLNRQQLRHLPGAVGADVPRPQRSGGHGASGDAPPRESRLPGARVGSAHRVGDVRLDAPPREGARAAADSVAGGGRQGRTRLRRRTPCGGVAPQLGAVPCGGRERIPQKF